MAHLSVIFFLILVDLVYVLKINLSVACYPEAEVIVITKEASLEPHLRGGSLYLGVLLPGDKVLHPHLPLGLGRPGPPSEQFLVRNYQWLPVVTSEDP